MDIKKVGAIVIVIVLIITLLLFIPFEKIYIEKSEPIRYMPGEKPIGLIEAYNYYIVLSYGNLLKQNQLRFFSQILKFNSSDYASSYFSEVIEEFEKHGFNVNLTYSNGIRKAVIIINQNGKESYSISILRENKIFYVDGDKIKIEKIIKWLMNQKL